MKPVKVRGSELPPKQKRNNQNLSKHYHHKFSACFHEEILSFLHSRVIDFPFCVTLCTHWLSRLFHLVLLLSEVKIFESLMAQLVNTK